LIRFTGGREITLRGLQDLGMQSGASGLILGNYLTTAGRSDSDDFAMLDRLGSKFCVSAATAPTAA